MWEMFWFFMVPLKIMIAGYIAYRVTMYFLGFL